MGIVRSGGSGASSPDDFRSSQLRARDMLRGDLEGKDLEEYVEQRVLTTTLEQASSPNGIVVRRTAVSAGYLEAMGSRPTIGTMPWETEAELVPFALTNWVASPAGVAPTGEVSLQPECPMSYELLRSSAM